MTQQTPCKSQATRLKITIIQHVCKILKQVTMYDTELYDNQLLQEDCCTKLCTCEEAQDWLDVIDKVRSPPRSPTRN